MPLSYTTISPQFLDYLASTYTRAQIEADPALCHYLENPYIKDNVELALKCEDAKHGGFDEKREFVQFLLCNGPEIEAQTILHYRNIILKNPELVEIASRYYSNIDTVFQLRTQVYGKTTSKDDGNCFSDPCNYLGPFSNVIGLMGDSRVYTSIRNMSAKVAKDKKKGEESSEEDMTANGPIRPSSHNQIPPKTFQEYSKLVRFNVLNAAAFIGEASEQNAKHMTHGGDENAIDDARAIEDATTLKVYSALGDCARLFAHSRQYRGGDARQNKQIALSMPMSYKWPYGSAITKQNRNTDSFAVPASITIPASANVVDGVFVEEGKDMLFTWCAGGNILTEWKDVDGERTEVILRDPNQQDPSAAAGKPMGSTTPGQVADGKEIYQCPSGADTFANSADSFSDTFLVGVYVDPTHVKRFFNHYYAGALEDSDISKLFANGCISAKVKFATSAARGGTVTAKVLSLPIIGTYGVSEASGTPLIAIDPTIVSCGNIHSSIRVVASDDAHEAKPVGNVSASGGEVENSSYGITSVQDPKKVEGGGTYRVENGVGTFDCRVRFYINSKSDKIASILEGKTIPDEAYSKGSDEGFFDIAPSATTSSQEAGFLVIANIISLMETGKVSGFNGYTMDSDNKGNKFVSYGFMNTNRTNLNTLLRDYYLPLNSGTPAYNVIKTSFSKYPNWYAPNQGEHEDIKNALIAAGNEPQMREAQMNFFKAVYFNECYTWWTNKGMQYPLSLLYLVHTKNNSGNFNVAKRLATNIGVDGTPEKEALFCEKFPNERLNNYKSMTDVWAKYGRGLENVINFFKSISKNHNLTGNILVTTKNVRLQGTDQPNPGQLA